MSPLNDERDEDFSRKKQTFFLSAEFLVTMLVQTGVFLIVGTTIVNNLEARVVALESQQVTAERIARIEEKMIVLINNQSDFKEAIKIVQIELRSQRRD
jgi:hypothetical protein